MADQTKNQVSTNSVNNNQPTTVEPKVNPGSIIHPSIKFSEASKALRNYRLRVSLERTILLILVLLFAFAVYYFGFAHPISPNDTIPKLWTNIEGIYRSVKQSLLNST